MLAVPQEFKDALKSPVKKVSGFLITTDGAEYLPTGDLQQYTIQTVGGFLRTAMSKFSATLLGEHALEGVTTEVYYGVDYDGDFHYILCGTYDITEAVYDKAKGTTAISGFDNMVRFDKPYVTVGSYPTTLYEYLQAITSLAGVVLQNEEIYNGTLELTEDYYKLVDEMTIRDVLEDVCEASASYAIINAQGNLELRQIAHTGETLTYDNLIEYELGEYWGGINSLVLSRQPQNDDVFLRDDADINKPMTRNLFDFNKFKVGYLENDD